MYIVMKNAQGCELDRKQVFHDQTISEALIEFIEVHETIISVGDKFEIVENEVDAKPTRSTKPYKVSTNKNVLGD